MQFANRRHQCLGRSERDTAPSDSKRPRHRDNQAPRQCVPTRIEHRPIFAHDDVAGTDARNVPVVLRTSRIASSLRGRRSNRRSDVCSLQHRTIHLDTRSVLVDASVPSTCRSASRSSVASAPSGSRCHSPHSCRQPLIQFREQRRAVCRRRGRGPCRGCRAGRTSRPGSRPARWRG